MIEESHQIRLNWTRSPKFATAGVSPPLSPQGPKVSPRQTSCQTWTMKLKRDWAVSQSGGRKRRTNDSVGRLADIRLSMHNFHWIFFLWIHFWWTLTPAQNSHFEEIWQMTLMGAATKIWQTSRNPGGGSGLEGARNSRSHQAKKTQKKANQLTFGNVLVERNKPLSWDTF